MPGFFTSGRMDHRSMRIAKIGGPTLAFVALVAWMTPPTTPRVPPSPLDAYKNIRSDAPTKDPAFGVAGRAFPDAPPIPRLSLRTPPATRTETVVTTYEAAEFWPEHQPAADGGRYAEEPQPAVAEPSRGEAEHAHAQQRAAWLAEMARYSDEQDDVYGDE